MHMNRLRVRERERGTSITKIIWTDATRQVIEPRWQ